MSWLPIERILWAPSNADHYNHLHVEGSPSKTGTPPQSNPGMSQSVQVIYEALRVEFGTPFYFEDAKPPAPCWSHMGWYNRRKISGSNSWSQHAWSNALDIGPYYGVEEQQKFYDFLTGDEPVSEADRMSKGDVNCAIDWNAAFGDKTQDTQQRLMELLVEMAVERQSGGTGDHSHKATVTLT